MAQEGKVAFARYIGEGVPRDEEGVFCLTGEDITTPEFGVLVGTGLKSACPLLFLFVRIYGARLAGNTVHYFFHVCLLMRCCCRGKLAKALAERAAHRSCMVAPRWARRWAQDMVYVRSLQIPKPFTCPVLLCCLEG